MDKKTGMRGGKQRTGEYQGSQGNTGRPPLSTSLLDFIGIFPRLLYYSIDITNTFSINNGKTCVKM